jgi:hypothetical protein
MTEDQAIRQRVKGLTSQVLQQGRVDSDAVRDVLRAVIGRRPGNAVSGAQARELFADAVRGLDEALVKSASATHGALQQLASRGKDFTDNDLKEALVSLRKLEEDYVAAANRVAEAMSGLRRERRARKSRFQTARDGRVLSHPSACSAIIAAACRATRSSQAPASAAGRAAAVTRAALLNLWCGLRRRRHRSQRGRRC